jgi:hypothetical protein
MKASLIAYDYGGLHNKSELKIVKYGYVKGSQKDQFLKVIWSWGIEYRVQAPVKEPSVHTWWVFTKVLWEIILCII